MDGWRCNTLELLQAKIAREYGAAWRLVRAEAMTTGLWRDVLVSDGQREREIRRFW